MDKPSPTLAHKLLLTGLKLTVLFGALVYFALSIISTYAYIYVEVDDTLDHFGPGVFSLTGMVEAPPTHPHSVQLLPVGLAGDEWVKETNADLPKGLIEIAAVAHEGKIYVAGGKDIDDKPSEYVYTATIIPDGPMDNSLTPWVMQAYTIPLHRDASGTAQAGLYGAAAAIYPHSDATATLYILGGVTDRSGGTSYFATDEVFRATVINATGEVGGFIRSTALITSFCSTGSDPRCGVSFHSAFVSGDRLYYVGGRSTRTPPGDHQYTNTYSAQIYADGSLSQWREEAGLPQSVDYGQVALYQGVTTNTVYHVGGKHCPDGDCVGSPADPGTSTYYVYYADIDSSNGNLTKWYTSSTDIGKGGNLPDKLVEHAAAMVNNGMIYIAGGKVDTLDAASISSTVQAAAVDPTADIRLFNWCEQDPGCEIGAWLASSFLPITLSNGSLVFWNQNLYYIGGSAGATPGTLQDEVYHGRISTGIVNARYAPKGAYTSEMIDPMADVIAPMLKDPVTLTHFIWQAKVPYLATKQQTLTMKYRYSLNEAKPISWEDWITSTSPLSSVTSGLYVFTQTLNITDVWYFQYQLDFKTTISRSSPIVDWVKLYYDVPDPDMQVSKHSDQYEGVWGGDLITYTVYYTAAGGAPAEGVVVTETIPDNTSAMPWNGDTGWVTVSQKVYTYYVGDIGYKGTKNISATAVSFSVQLTTARKPEIQAITNYVCINFPPMVDYMDNPISDPILSNNCFTLPIPWHQVYWDIAKVATPTHGSTVEPGQVITYAIWFTNTGNATEDTTVITDVVDTGLLESITPHDDGVLTGDTINWTLYDVPPNNRYALGFTAIVKGPVDFASATIINTADIQSTHGELTNSLPITHLIAAEPEFRIVKVAIPPHGSTVEPGDALSYTIYYSNTGTRNVSGVVISDVVDTNLLKDIAPLDGGVLLPDGKTINWTVSVPANGQTFFRSFTATVKTMDVPLAELVNKANIRFEQIISESVAVTHSVIAVPLLTLVKSSAPPFGLNPGEIISYFLAYHNAGTMNIPAGTPLFITDVVPTYALTDIVPYDGGVLLPDGQTITWTSSSHPALPAGGTFYTVSFSATVRLDASGFFTNDAWLDDPLVGITTSQKINYASTNPILSITKTNGITLVAPSQYVTYTITYSKPIGTLGAENVIITETIPVNASIAPWDAANWTSVGGQVYKQEILSMSVDISQTTIAIQVDPYALAGTTVTNTAEIDASNNVPGGNQVATDEDEVKEAVGLAVSKRDGLTQIGTGQSVNYTVRFTNTGNKPTTVILTDTLAQYLSSTGAGWNVVGGGVYTREETLAAFGNGSVTLQATMALTPPGSVGSVTNQVQIDSADRTETTGQETASDTDSIVGPSLWVTKTTTSAVFDPDEIVVYTINYGNSNSQATATGVVITEVIDITVVDYEATTGWVPVSTSTYSLAIGTLNPGQTGSATFKVKVKSGLEPATPFTNTLYINGTNVRVAPESPVFLRNQLRGPDLTFTPMEIELSHNAPTTNNMVTIKVTVTTPADSVPLKEVIPPPVYSTTVGSEIIYNVSVELYVKERTAPDTPTNLPTGPDDHLDGLCQDVACTGGGRYADYFRSFASKEFNETAGKTRVVEFQHRFEKRATYDVYVQVDIYVPGYIGHSPDYGDYKEGLNESNNILARRGVRVTWGDTYLPVVLK